MRNAPSDPKMGEKRAAFPEIPCDELARGGDVEPGVLVRDVEVELPSGGDERPSQDTETVGDQSVGPPVAGYERHDPGSAIPDVGHGEDRSGGGRQVPTHRELVTERVLVRLALPAGAGALLEHLDLPSRQPVEQTRKGRSRSQDILVQSPSTVPCDDIR